VRHTYPVPPVAELVAIGAANHLTDPGVRPYNRLSFTFTSGFPTYRFKYEPSWVTFNNRGIELDGGILLVILFTPAQAHTPDGHSSVGSQPPSRLGLSRMVNYTQADDTDGLLVYTIGVPWTQPDKLTSPQYPVRVYEVTYVNGLGDHRYVVAVDIDAR
jgi:hypothetical protein